MSRLAPTLLWFVVGTTVACGHESARMTARDSEVQPVPAGDRILSVQANIGEDGNFDGTLDEARRAGSEAQVLPVDWNTIETAPGTFEPPTDLLAIANAYYPDRGIPIHLIVRPIHTNQKVVPADLVDAAIDAPETIVRFKRLLDWVATRIPRITLTSLSIGSEVDIYMWGDSTRWDAWTTFYAAVAPYARGKFPGTLISCETTQAAFVGPDRERLRRLHQFSDAIGVSYYPMENGLHGVRPPSAVHGDFAGLRKRRG